MYRQVKVSAISIKPKKWDKEHNYNLVESYFRLAASENPDLILTTEGVLEGYGIMEVLEGRQSPDKLFDIAEPIDGPYINRFRELAIELKTCLCFGFAEIISNNLYNTAVFIDKDGLIRGKYHKTQFAEGTIPTCNFNRVGNALRAFDTPIGRMGFIICNDRWNPMITRALVLDGAQVILIPSWGSKSKEQNRTVLARARENGVPIVEANVGMNLIINKGEIVAYDWGNNKVTTGIIDVPAPVSVYNARQYEREYLKLQHPEMEKRFQRTMKRIKENSIFNKNENCPCGNGKTFANCHYQSR